MFVCKRPAGSGLQVLLERGRTLIVIKTDYCHNTPWHMPRSVGGAALIVSDESLLWIIRQSNIALLGVREAL